MSSCRLLLPLCVLLLAGAAIAQIQIQRAKIKRVDADGKKITLTVDGEDKEFAVTEATRIWDGDMRELPERLSNKLIKVGADVQFRAAKKDGKDVLEGLKVNVLPQVDLSHLKPLTEFGKDKYQDYEGGLYPDGKNERPANHEKAGLERAAKIEPLDSDGRPNPDGKIVLLSVGMSNASQVFGAFKTLADQDREKNPKLVIVNGAQGGMTAARIQDDQDNGDGTRYWTVTDNILANARVSPAQVQAAWIKQADAGPRDGFPKYAQTLQAEIAKIVQILHRRYPNIKLVYLSSRTYGGYATTRLNPEPYAFESGFAVKWLIEQQLKGEKSLNFEPSKGLTSAPWLSWGPYLWAKGETANAEGLSYEQSDYRDDGTHPSAQGQRKVGMFMLEFFKKDSTTKSWFLKLKNKTHSHELGKCRTQRRKEKRGGIDRTFLLVLRVFAPLREIFHVRIVCVIRPQLGGRWGNASRKGAKAQRRKEKRGGMDRTFLLVLCAFA